MAYKDKLNVQFINFIIIYSAILRCSLHGILLLKSMKSSVLRRFSCSGYRKWPCLLLVDPDIAALCVAANTLRFTSQLPASLLFCLLQLLICILLYLAFCHPAVKLFLNLYSFCFELWSSLLQVSELLFNWNYF